MNSRDRKSLEKSNQRLQNPWNFFIYCDLNHYCGMSISNRKDSKIFCQNSLSRNRRNHETNSENYEKIRQIVGCQKAVVKDVKSSSNQ